MNCEHCRRQLCAYVVAALSARATRRLDAHLADCAECRAELAALHATGDLLATMPRAQGCPEAWTAVAARLDPPAARRVRRPVIAWAGAGALAIAAAVIFWPPVASEPAATSEFITDHQRLAQPSLLGGGALGDLFAAAPPTEQ